MDEQCINDNIKDRIILDYGMDKTIEFCEMVSMMYKMLHDDIVKKGYDDMTLNIYEYDYESEWWKNKCEELKKTKDEGTRIN